MKHQKLAAIGLFSGFMFFIHAMVPNSHAWPLMWPAIGGALAAASLLRDHPDARLGSSLKASITVGGAAAIVFFVATVAALGALSLPALDGLARALGSNGATLIGLPALKGLAFAAAIGAIVACVAGLVAHPIFHQRRPSR